VEEVIPFSQEFRKVLEGAAELAAAGREPADSGLLVLAIFLVPCEAQSVLLEMRLEPEALADRLRQVPKEAPGTWEANSWPALRIARARPLMRAASPAWENSCPWRSAVRRA